MADPLTVDVITCGTNSPASPRKKTSRATDPESSLTLYATGSNPNVKTKRKKTELTTIKSLNRS